MVSPYSSIEKDVYGHISLILLVGSALLLMSNFDNSALIIASVAGSILIFLYYQRIRKLPINIRTPVSDVFIALGSIISTLFIINQISYTSLPDLFSTFNPLLAISLLSFGIISKLFLLEQLFKELFRVFNGFKNGIINWALKSRKNKWRVSLVIFGLILFLTRFIISDSIVKNFFTTTSLVMFSSVLLLDINEIDQLRSTRKVSTTLASIMMFSGVFQFSSDYQNVGMYFLGGSLIVTSIDRNKFAILIRNILRLFQTFLINLSYVIVDIFKTVTQRIRENYILVSRGISFSLGAILIYIPSSSELKIVSTSIVTLDFLGGALIFIATLPTAIKIMKKYGLLMYLSIRHYGPLIVIQIYFVLISVSSWFIRNNKRITKLITTSFSFIVIVVGPKIYFLNFILGFSLLSIIYKTQISKTLNWFLTQFHWFVNYFISDYSRTIGNFGILSIFLTVLLKDKNPNLLLLMIFLTTISLSVGWDFAIFRFFDMVISWLVYIIEGSKRLFVAIFTILYHRATLGRAVSLISWMVFILALFDYTTFNRWILFLTWIILWHVAYSYRVKRLGKIARNIAFTISTFVKNIFISIKIFLRNVIKTIWIFLKRAAVIVYSHTFVLIFWTIGLFFLIIGIILIIPVPFELTRNIFGNVADDMLISFIIGVTLFSSAILSIQQTYVRKDKLMIGGIQN